MSILRKAVDRLANFFRFDHKVILRFAVDRYNASYVVPLIEKLIADGEDGDTYRSALAAWNRARSEEHTSELQSLMRISYAVFCLKKKKEKYSNATQHNISNKPKL